MNLLKQVGASLIFMLIVLEWFAPDLPGVFKLTERLKVFKLTKRLEPTVPERMSAISLSKK